MGVGGLRVGGEHARRLVIGIELGKRNLLSGADDVPYALDRGPRARRGFRAGLIFATPNRCHRGLEESISGDDPPEEVSPIAGAAISLASGRPAAKSEMLRSVVSRIVSRASRVKNA